MPQDAILSTARSEAQDQAITALLLVLLPNLVLTVVGLLMRGAAQLTVSGSF